MKSYDEIDYSKDKFASEDFLDSLIFWIVVVGLVLVFVFLK